MPHYNGTTVKMYFNDKNPILFLPVNLYDRQSFDMSELSKGSRYLETARTLRWHIIYIFKNICGEIHN